MSAKGRWPRPEFLPLRQRPPTLAWLWAATGIAVLAVTLIEGISTQRDIDARNVQLAEAKRRLPKASPTPSAPSPASAKSEGDAMRAARRVTSQLDHPWGQILSTVESETPVGLQWLLFDHSSDSPDLRFEGLAPDIATALQLVDVLSARAGWSQVALGRLQAPDARDAAAARPMWRFELTAVVDAQRISAPQADAGS